MERKFDGIKNEINEKKHLYNNNEIKIRKPTASR